MGTLIADLFPSTARTAEGVPRLADGELYPEELSYIRSAVAKRRAEFATARTLARQALAALGVAPLALVPGADRAPVWPPGIVGSITHTRDYCAVVVDRAPPLGSIGLDVETLQALEASELERVLTVRERAWLLGQAPESRAALGMLFFSAKEAYYKCQYPLTGKFLDFLDVELEISLAENAFQARVLSSGWPAGVERVAGRFVFRAGKVLCGIALGASGGGFA
jgi:4'-phosphopantetheinyl transferase EntD